MMFKPIKTQSESIYKDNRDLYVEKYWTVPGRSTELRHDVL